MRTTAQLHNSPQGQDLREWRILATNLEAKLKLRDRELAETTEQRDRLVEAVTDMMQMPSSEAYEYSKRVLAAVELEKAHGCPSDEADDSSPRQDDYDHVDTEFGPFASETPMTDAEEFGGSCLPRGESGFLEMLVTAKFARRIERNLNRLARHLSAANNTYMQDDQISADIKAALKHENCKP